MLWSGEFASAGRVAALMPARVDATSSQPALKAGRAEVRRRPELAALLAAHAPRLAAE
jgi:hypothetical protein